MNNKNEDWEEDFVDIIMIEYRCIEPYDQAQSSIISFLDGLKATNKIKKWKLLMCKWHYK